MTTRCELSAQLDELYGLLATFEAAALRLPAAGSADIARIQPAVNSVRAVLSSVVYDVED